MAPEDETDNILFARVFKGSAPIEVTQPLHAPTILHIIAPPLPEGSLTKVEGKVVEIETSELPKPEEVLASLSAQQARREGAEGQAGKRNKGPEQTEGGKGRK